MAKDLQKDLQELLTGGFLKVVKDNRGEYYCLTDNNRVIPPRTLYTTTNLEKN